MLIWQLLQLKWDSILNGEEEPAEARLLAECNVRDPVWSELGVLEVGIERIHLRRASLPAGRSGLWTSNFASSCRLSEVDSPAEEEANASAVTNAQDINLLNIESRTLRSLLSKDNTESTENEEPSSLTCYDSASGDIPQHLSGLPLGLSTHLPHRRESLPFNFPDRYRSECFSRLGRRESLPTDCSRTLNITSIAPLSFGKKEKRVSQSNCAQPATSVPSTGSIENTNYGCTDEKENIVSTAAYLKTVRINITTASMLKQYFKSF